MGAHLGLSSFKLTAVPGGRRRAYWPVCARPADPRARTKLRCDARQAAELLGWQPEVSLAEGLARTREWMAGRIEAGVAVA